MSQVNPPFLIKKLRPREGIVEKLGDDIGGALNNYLDQLERYNEQMYRRTGGTTDQVINQTEISNINGRLAEIDYQITEDPFTMDSTGWTMDTTRLTMDMSEA